MPSCSSEEFRDAAVRVALKNWLAVEVAPAELIDEFWIPEGNERADLVALGNCCDAFEIKTHRDNLSRLPRQAQAFSRIFGRCTLVVDGCHLEQAKRLVPPWWGIVLIQAEGGAVQLYPARRARTNPDVDREVLVKLLW